MAYDLYDVRTRPVVMTLVIAAACWVIAVTQAMLPLLRKAPAARIVNVSSTAGSLMWNSDPNNPHRAMFGTYSASKTAFNAITEAFLAANLGGRCEALEEQLDESSVLVPVGADRIPGLPAALAHRLAAKR